MSSDKVIVIFHRNDCWYPVEFSSYRVLRKDLEEHVRLNPGTTKVTDGQGKVLWEQKER